MGGRGLKPPRLTACLGLALLAALAAGPSAWATYARPQAATPLFAPLVPAHANCALPNRLHSTPLGVESCSPPDMLSQNLTVGTGDNNGAAVNFVGSLRLNVHPGDPGTPADEADVGIAVHLTDIRCQAGVSACTGGAMSDYTGQVTAFLLAKITDRQSGDTGDEPATGNLPNFKLPGRFTVPCTPTSDPAIGSACDVVTSIDTLTPNAIREGKRSIWELDQIHISDGGPHGDPQEFAGTPFLIQGLFVP
jgi:hypothetical protein